MTSALGAPLTRRLTATLSLTLVFLCAAPVTVLAQGSQPAGCSLAAVPDVGGGIFRVPPLSGLSFACVVSAVMDGRGNNGAGFGTNIIQNLLPLATTLLIVVVLAELAFIGLFSGTNALNDLTRAFVRLVLVAALLQYYGDFVSIFRTLAVDGANGMTQLVQQATGTPASAPQFAAGRGSAREQAQQVAAEYNALQDKIQAGTATPADQARYQQLADAMDLGRCQATAAAAQQSGNVDDAGYASMMAFCQEVQRQAGVVSSIWANTKQFFQNLNPFDFVNEIINKGVIGIASTVLEFVLSVVLAAVSGILALMFALLASFGPVFVALLGSRRAAGGFRWWFSSLAGVSLLPVVQGAVLGFYYGGVDALVTTYSSNSWILVLTAYTILEVTLVVALIAGYQAVARFSGGALDAAMTIGGVAAGAVFSVGAGAVLGGIGGAVGAAGSAGRSASLGARALGFTKGAIGGALKEAGRQHAMAAGAVATAATRSPTAGDVTTGGLVGGGKLALAAAKWAIAAPRRDMSQPSPSGNDGPTPPITDTERAVLQAQAGHQLTESLERGDDYRVDDTSGAVRLTAQGNAKVAAHRRAHSATQRAFAGMSDDTLVNTPAVRDRLLGAHQSDLDAVLGPDDGSEARALAEALPAAVTAVQPGESREQAASRITRLVEQLRNAGGGSWVSVDHDLQQLRALSQRQAVASDGVRYGISIEDVTPEVPPPARRYSAEPGSAYAERAASAPAEPGEAIYDAVRRSVVARSPQGSSESTDTYEARIHAQIFTAANA